MNVHFEAASHSSHDGVITLTDEEADEYRALTSDEARHEWLKGIVHEVVYDGDHVVLTEIDNEYAYVQDDG